MELSGNLADFALSDILQILALSRKTGVVLVENGYVQGRIVLENGRVVYAFSSDQYGLEERIAKQTGIKIESLQSFKGLASSQDSCWTFEDLLIESGLLTKMEMITLVRDHIFGSITKLVSIEKGRFGIALNEAEYRQPVEEIRLRDGVEVNEVLLEAAKKRDEEGGYELERKATSVLDPNGQTEKFASDNAHLLIDMAGYIDNDINMRGEREVAQAALLCSFLSELRVLSYESEVILTVMRFCSEFASRGVLFSLFGQHLRGIGKFGIEWEGDSKGIEEAIRSLTIPIDEAGIFREAIVMERPVVKFSEDDFWLGHLRTVLGGSRTGLEAFLVPISSSVGKGVSYLIYGDNYPGVRGITYVDSVIAFINQASLTIEKLILEKQLKKTIGYKRIGQNR